MKLLELLEREWADSGLKNKLQNAPGSSMTKAVDNAQADSEHEYVGSGSNAYVGRSTNQHELDNVSRISTDDDGTSKFYQWLIDNPQARSNPYFPKIRSYSTADHTTTAVVERLYPFKSPKLNSKELRVMVWEEIFNAPLPEIEGTEKNQASWLGIILIHRINCTTRNKGRGFVLPIKDPIFKQAVECMRACRCGYIDIHADNVMWRMTGNKPQLVITDPFVSKGNQ